MAANCPLIAFLCLAGALLTAGGVVNQGCPKDWTPFENRCFKFINTKASWINAEKGCNSYEANLASIHSPGENAFIVDLIKESAGRDTRTWIGAYDAIQDGTWLWSDGSPWDYNFWSTTPTSSREHVADIYGASYWNDRAATTTQEYICAKDAPPKPQPPHKSVSIIFEGFLYKCTPDTDWEL